MKRSMKEIALYLLEQYGLSESSVIGEFSGSIEKDLAKLDNEIAELRREIEEADRTVSIDAVPIKFIEKRIAELTKLNEYEFIANGGYTSPSDYEQWELERLIRDWRAQNDEIH